MTTQANQPTNDVNVHVTFATAKSPFNAHFSPETTVATVLDAALTKFEVSADGTTRYFFVYDGRELSAAETLGSLLDHGRSLKLSLRTETISG